MCALPCLYMVLKQSYGISSMLDEIVFDMFMLCICINLSVAILY